MEQSDMSRESGAPERTGSRPGRTAEEAAAFRAAESMLPKDKRICYDPFAIRFVDPDRLDDVIDYTDEHFPGLRNYIVARTRHFDDIIRMAAKTGLEQLVILGAGYDTRPYRIDEFKGRVRVFEIDHPDTQQIKKEKIKNIFGSLPEDVVYIPVDVWTQEFGNRLLECGYTPAKKTLFVMEGVMMHLTPPAIDAILSFVVINSGRGSALLFDCPTENGDNDASPGEIPAQPGGQNARGAEPILFSIPKESPGAFLRARGFSRIRTVPGEDYRRLYFHGKNEDRELICSSSFIYAVVGDR